MENNTARLYVNSHYCKGCGICVTECPVDALEMSDTMNERGYFMPRELDMAKCRRCGMCMLMCPDFAIIVE